MTGNERGAEPLDAPRRTLYLMRHAAAEFEAPSDHARPLSVQGRQEARGAALAFAQREHLPDELICSSALRTRTTAEILATTWQDRHTESEINLETRATDELYEAHPRAVLKLITELNSSHTEVFIVGHEPTMSLLTELLVGRDSGSTALHIVRAGFVTAAVARIDFDTSWDLVAPGTGILRGVTPPPSG